MESQNSRAILLVEDEQDIRDAIRETLEDEGYRVATASNGLEALAYLNANPEPSLILLDLFMPVMTGSEFVDALEKRFQSPMDEIPIIAVTAAPRQSSVVQSIGNRVTGMVRKPIHLDSFLDQVDLFCG